MISKKISTKLIKISTQLIELPDSPNKHFSFLIRRKKVVSVGWNSYTKTHPLAKNYFSQTRHSELSAIINAKKGVKVGECMMVNIRLNFLGQILMSRPCSRCLSLLREFGISKVLYTDANGSFVAL